MLRNAITLDPFFFDKRLYLEASIGDVPDEKL